MLIGDEEEEDDGWLLVEELDEFEGHSLLIILVFSNTYLPTYKKREEKRDDQEDQKT